MADEEQTNAEETEETTEAPEAAEEAAPEAAEAPAEETTETEEPAAEAAEPEAAPEEPAESEAAEEPAEQASAPAPAAEKVEAEPAAHPKEIRSRKRSAHSGEALPQRDVETRAGERAASRKKAADDRRRYRAKHKGSGPAGEGTPRAEREPGAKKVRRGIVVSDKGDKTITVKVEVVHRHRRYEKVIRRSDTLHAHDERNEAGAGDTVRVVESRPLSRTKRWRLIEVVEKAR